MSLSIGIIGLPNVGKSTLFNALLKRQAALAANYPFATIEPNVGVVDVPDPRLKVLAEIVKEEYTPKGGSTHKEIPERIMPAVVKFYDIAGIVKGASKGEGLGNQFLSHIRETDALIHVVRNFEDDNVIRAGSVGPDSDIAVVNTELVLADLESLSKRLAHLEADAKKNKSPENLQKLDLYKKVFETLDTGKLAASLNLSAEDSLLVKDLNLLTLKPMIYVFNIAEGDLSDLSDQPKVDGVGAVTISAKIESELSSLNEEDQRMYMKELGISESGLDKIIKKGFDLLGLQTYLTAGPKEVRAWTIKKGTKAPEAAGVIHTDFERGFISAEIISFEDLVGCRGWKAAKEKGLLRVEGKTYVMKDGDVVEFRFSV